MIEPTVGRVVWYYAAEANRETQPNAAMVAYVHSPAVVNLSVIDKNGVQSPRTSVILIQEGDKVPDCEYCCWMPYQIQTAKKNA